MHLLWKKAAALGFLVFLGLWVVGIIRGETLSSPSPLLANPLQSARIENVSRSVQAANNLRQLGFARMALPLMLDAADIGRIEVYEQTASLTSTSDTFDASSARIRTALEEHHGRVFKESNTGLAPVRLLTLEVGVQPERFEALVEELREIGHLESISVQKHDRTGDLHRLHAQRQTLKKHLEAVQKLRGGNNPSIEDTLKVEQKIQDIEKEMQALSVQLGELLGKESLYHVHLTLQEKQPDTLARPAGLPRRVFAAFLWALAWWTAGLASLAVLAATGLSVRTLWTR
jgi:hypothetical protein